MDQNKTIGNDDEKEFIEKLLRMVKREVKQIMEEVVTRKFVHEESGSITSFCAAVDACLSHGLKRRALGLFKTNSTTALLQKVAKNCDSACLVLKKVNEIENADPNKRSSSSSDSLNRTRMSFKIKSNQGSNGSLTNSNSYTSTASTTNNNNCNTINNNSNCSTSIPTRYRFLWIRIALFEKYLISIVDHVVENSSKYYEREALVSDPVAGQIFASLLVGPCALDYTKMKTLDQFWTDPPADELVQRHRLSSSMTSSSNSSKINQSTPPSNRKPLGMTYRKNFHISNGTDHDDHCSPSSTKTANSASGSVCWSPRDYVESLHQNSKSTLLYGKNNVIMQPNDDEEPMPGYLSLHQDSFGLRVMWTPNNLINVRVEHNAIENSETKSINKLWDFALNVSLDNIVYLHCHQQRHDCGSIVMVGRDGVMHPPIKFPKGGHLLSFLSCLETGLMPYGQLDPPLWSQKGRGKILPKLRRKGQSLDKNTAQTNDENQDDGDFAADYVFRIISISDKPETISNELFEPKSEAHKLEDHNCGGSERDPDNKSFNQGWTPLSQMLDDESEQINDINSAAKDKQHLKLLCDTMRKQIISRAFYGWLAYCRHLKTVRTHLSGLVNGTIYSIDKPTDASEGITVKVWENIRNPNGQIKIDPMEFYRLVYYGGIDQSIRSDVWLYLLDHFHFDDTVEDRKRKDQKMRQNYELIMSEWLAVEAIVRQRDREIVAANLAKLSSESQNNSTELFQDKSIYQSGNKLNDVFDDSIEKNIETVANDSRFDDDSDDNKRKEKCQHHRSLDYDNDRNDTEERLNPSESDYNSAPPTPDSSMQTSSSKSRHQFGANHRKQLIRHQKIESVNSEVTQNILITNPSVDPAPIPTETSIESKQNDLARLPIKQTNNEMIDTSPAASPASSNGGLYSNELLDLFSLNLHRIDKDVQRCDRNFWYFNKDNLEKLRNVMCTYVWNHLDVGYVQGMCDLVAPLLVIFDDEVHTYSCFCKLMIRMASNFPHGGAMDTHFANMRSLIQILDSDVFELMHQNGDYTHFYFCYRWFLLDFKRELLYVDVFSVWETIWAAKFVSSSAFVLFIALALVEYYRDIILENNMDFTDIIKFFNEMAERHDAKAVLKIARDLVYQIQTMVETK
ncbi:small G protein signaling modulator 2-like [Sarcoptes scabiei]|nr:small G protein signaling modulator 2-like [Sarcoptes scabiei]